MNVGGLHFNEDGLSVWRNDDARIVLMRSADGKAWCAIYDDELAYSDTGYHHEPEFALIQLRENLKAAWTYFDTHSSLPDVSGRT